MSRATKCATQEGQDRCSQSQVVLVADRVGRDMRHRQSVSPPSIATIPIYLIRAHHHVPLLEGRSEHCLAIADEGVAVHGSIQAPAGRDASRRNPTVKMVVFQWSWGWFPISRWPLRQRMS